MCRNYLALQLGGAETRKGREGPFSWKQEHRQRHKGMKEHVGGVWGKGACLSQWGLLRCPFHQKIALPFWSLRDYVCYCI